MNRTARIKVNTRTASMTRSSHAYGRRRSLSRIFTGHRGGVYFEAGFALGLGREVIWTCRKDDMKDLHFDIRQYNTLDWEDPEDLATRLQHRIEVTVGKDPKTVVDS